MSRERGGRERPGLRPLCGRRRRTRGREAGTVTAELALALPAVVLVLAVLLVTASASAAQLACLDGARAGARVAAIGRPDTEVAAAARRVAGGTATVAVRRDPPWVEVHVSAPGPGAWFTGGRLSLSAVATAWVEP